MKVAIVTHFPEDIDAPRGGVEAVSVNLTRALAELDTLELHVITADPGRTVVDRRMWKKVTIHRLPLLGRRALSGAIGPNRTLVSEYLRRLAPEVVHAHDIYGLMVNGLQIPRVFTIHGFIHGDTLVSGERWAWLRSQVWRWVETRSWSEHPRIIAISPYVRERLRGIATGVIHDIDNPVAESFFHSPRTEHKGAIFSAAVIYPRKNTLGLIEAFARLLAMGVDAELRLAGPITDPDYGRRVQERIRAHGLSDRVALLGGITSEQVAQELGRASAFALVSLEENSPMGIAEAMAVGVPVVTSNRCGMPYMVRHGETGSLVDPNDPDGIAWRLRQLLEDDALRKRMGDTARSIAQDRFHPAAVARRTREVYLEALRERDARAAREKAITRTPMARS